MLWLNPNANSFNNMPEQVRSFLIKEKYFQDEGLSKELHIFSFTWFSAWFKDVTNTSEALRGLLLSRCFSRTIPSQSKWSKKENWEALSVGFNISSCLLGYNKASLFRCRACQIKMIIHFQKWIHDSTS